MIQFKKRLIKKQINNAIVALSFIGFSLSATVAVIAQQQSALQTVQALNLPVSKGNITIYYADGYEKRAAEVRPLIEEMMAFYEKKLGIKENFSVAVLTREQWTKNLPPMIPYGLPFVRDNIAFLPATSDGVVTLGAIALKSTASPTTLKNIKASGYEFDAGAAKFTDLIGLHELGHVYTTAYGINPPTRWFSEFLASYFAYAFLKEKHPKLAVLMQAMATDVYSDGVKPEHTSFEDFERLYSGVGINNYGWYQGKFIEKGAQIYDAQNLKFLAEVKKAFPADEKETVSQAATLERLEKISPGMTNWSKNLK